MSVTLMAKVFAVDLPKPEKFLLLALADHASDTGHSVFPGRQALAAKTSDSPRNVSRLLAALEARGLIVAVAYRKGGPGKATNWRIDVDVLSAWPKVDTTRKVKVDTVRNVATGDSNPNLDTTEPQPGHHGASTWTPPATQPSGTVIEPSTPTEYAPATTNGALSHTEAKNTIVAALNRNPTQLTRTAWGEIDKASKDLRAVGATAPEIHRRIRNWPLLWPGTTPTPSAVVKHWDRLDDPQPPPSAGQVGREVRRLRMLKAATE